MNEGRTVDYTFDIYTHRGHGAIGGIRDHWDEYEQRLLNVGGPYIIPEKYH